MWQVDNRTPFAADRIWVRDKNGAEVWLVALKCTFDVLPDGATVVSKEQLPVLHAAEHYGDPGKSSIKLESDLVRTKTTTDVIVVGNAHAPGGMPTTRMEVGFRVGPLKKQLLVYGDRKWGTLGPTAPEAFIKMPLVYERAFGGVDGRSSHPEKDWEWRNPVGIGFAVSRENAHGTPVPNIEYPGETLGLWSDRPRPAGFGPIASHWQPRAGFAGTYDDKWMKSRQPLLPEDFDDRHFQSAPPDQQTSGFLRGGEEVVLRGMTPGHGEVRFRLPRLFPGFETHFFDGTSEVHRDRSLHTVILEPEYPRVTLVWHTALPCHFKVQKLQRTAIRLKRVVGDSPPDAANDQMDAA